MKTEVTRPAEQITADTLLIVDDDAINRKVLGKIFSGCYQVEEAQDGAAGLKSFWTIPTPTAPCCWM